MSGHFESFENRLLSHHITRQLIRSTVHAWTDTFQRDYSVGRHSEFVYRKTVVFTMNVHQVLKLGHWSTDNIRIIKKTFVMMMLLIQWAKSAFILGIAILSLSRNILKVISALINRKLKNVKRLRTLIKGNRRLTEWEDFWISQKVFSQFEYLDCPVFTFRAKFLVKHPTTQIY